MNSVVESLFKDMRTTAANVLLLIYEMVLYRTEGLFQVTWLDDRVKICQAHCIYLSMTLFLKLQICKRECLRY